MTTAIGLPVQPERKRRTVYTAPITSPQAGDTFAPGDTTTVTWDTSALSAYSRNNGTLVLGFLQNGDPDEHLDIEHPLASGFILQTGKQSITFPATLPTRTGYILALLGDSGNISPQFTIQAQS